MKYIVCLTRISGSDPDKEMWVRLAPVFDGQSLLEVCKKKATEVADILFQNLHDQLSDAMQEAERPRPTDAWEQEVWEAQQEELRTMLAWKSYYGSLRDGFLAARSYADLAGVYDATTKPVQFEMMDGERVRSPDSGAVCYAKHQRCVVAGDLLAIDHLSSYDDHYYLSVTEIGPDGSATHTIYEH